MISLHCDWLIPQKSYCKIGPHIFLIVTVHYNITLHYLAIENFSPFTKRIGSITCRLVSLGVFSSADSLAIINKRTDRIVNRSKILWNICFIFSSKWCCALVEKNRTVVQKRYERKAVSIPSGSKNKDQPLVFVFILCALLEP